MDTLNDMRNFIADKTIEGFTGYTLKLMNEFIVLNSFEKEYNEEIVDGFVFSTKSMLNKLDELMKNNEVKNFMVDGTYKISYNKWILLNLGTVIVYYNQEDKQYKHKFIPLAFCFTNAENSCSY
jgi:hypothetical protein